MEDAKVSNEPDEELSTIQLPRTTLDLIRHIRTHHRITVREVFRRFCDPVLQGEWDRVVSETNARLKAVGQSHDFGGES